MLGIEQISIVLSLLSHVADLATSNTRTMRIPLSQHSSNRIQALDIRFGHRILDADKFC